MKSHCWIALLDNQNPPGACRAAPARPTGGRDGDAGRSLAIGEGYEYGTQSQDWCTPTSGGRGPKPQSPNL